MREAQKHVDPVDPDPQHWYIGTYLSVAPLYSLQPQLLQEDPLGLLLALLEQLAHKLPVGLGNARLAG